MLRLQPIHQQQRPSKARSLLSTQPGLGLMAHQEFGCNDKSSFQLLWQKYPTARPRAPGDFVPLATSLTMETTAPSLPSLQAPSPQAFPALHPVLRAIGLAEYSKDAHSQQESSSEHYALHPVRLCGGHTTLIFAESQAGTRPKSQRRSVQELKLASKA